MASTLAGNVIDGSVANLIMVRNAAGKRVLGPTFAAYRAVIGTLWLWL